MHTPGIKYVYMQIFMFVGVSVIEILLFNRKKKKKKNISLVPRLPPLARNYCVTFELVRKHEFKGHAIIARKEGGSLGTRLEEHGNSVKIEITCITPVLQAILDFFPDIISFQHVFLLGVGRQIEWKLKELPI